MALLAEVLSVTLAHMACKSLTDSVEVTKKLDPQVALLVPSASTSPGSQLATMEIATEIPAMPEGKVSLTDGQTRTTAPSLPEALGNVDPPTAS